jgi:ribosomal protein S24E
MPQSGTQAANIEADVYDDETTMKAVELGHVLQRHSIGEKKGAGEKEEAEAEAPKAA